MTSAEDVKRVVREYADEHCPEWEVASVHIRIGEVAKNPDEVLVIIREAPQPPSCNPELPPA